MTKEEEEVCKVCGEPLCNDIYDDGGLMEWRCINPDCSVYLLHLEL